MGRVRTFINGKEIGHMFLVGKEVQVAYIDGKKVYEIPKEEANLLFYAPLTQDKNAVYANDNLLTPLIAGSGTVINNSLYLPTQAQGNAIMWNSFIPIGKSYTISSYITSIAQSGGNSAFYGIHPNPMASNRGLFIQTNNANTYFYVGIGNAVFSFNVTPSIITMNQKMFITTVWINDETDNRIWSVKVYVNGNLTHTWNPTTLTFLGISGAEHPSIGLINSGNTGAGYYSQFSIYNNVLNDNEIMQLCQNDGVPQGF